MLAHQPRMRIAKCILCAGSSVLAMGSAACGSSTVAPTPEPMSVSVEIGVPAGADGLDFAPLSPGGELRLQSFGQGGTHVL